MAHYPELFVLRHGQTEWNLQGRYQGRMDSALTPLGLQQATQQHKILSRVLGGRCLVCFVSPQGRAVKTVDLALAGLGIDAVKNKHLMEIDFGDWEGRTRQEIAAGLPVEMWESQSLAWYFQSPNGERYGDMVSRVKRFLDTLSGPSIVVTHGVTSMVLRGLWLGFGEAESLQLPHNQGCVYHLKDDEERCLEV